MTSCCFRPMASAMGHHFGNALISRYWTEVNNDLVHRAVKLYPDRFVGVCSLPQSPGVSPQAVCRGARALRQGSRLHRVQSEPRFHRAGSGRDRRSATRPGIPSYEKLQELDAAAMLHASATCNPAFHTTGSHYLNTDAHGIHAADGIPNLPGFPAAASDHHRTAAATCRSRKRGTGRCAS